MKFRDIMSILVSLCMILTACQSANDSNIYSNATGVYADVTAEQCDGISTAEFHKMVPEETWQFAMVGYYFFWDADQKPCVAYWPAPDDTVYCQAFDPTRIGTSASDFAKIEFETMYTGAQQTRHGAEYDFDVWANMLNFYLFQEYAGAIAPYVGLGIGFATIWGDIDAPYGHMSDSVFDLSYSAMIGVNFALNDRVDLNLGIKYQYYGEVEHERSGNEYGVTDVDATEFYFGAVYKFGL